MRVWLFFAGLNAFIAVAASAYGVHALADLPPDRMSLYQTAVQFQFMHAVPMLAIAWLADRTGRRIFDLAGVAFLFGIVFFCGTLYVLAVKGALPPNLPNPTPIGGGGFLVGWALIVLGAILRGSFR